MADMKIICLGLLFLVTAGGLAAKPLTFTFKEYEEDYRLNATVIGADKAYSLQRLTSEEPIVQLSFKLSPEGNGELTKTIGDSTVTVEVLAVPNKDSAYQIKVNHEYISAYDGDTPITSSRGTDVLVLLVVGEPTQIAKLIETKEVDGEKETHAHVMVAELTE